MLLILFLMLATIGVIDRGTAQSDRPKIYVDPALNTGPSGGDFTVGIKVANITSDESLYAWEFHLGFDPDVLSVFNASRYFRSDNHTVNLQTGRKLLTDQSGVEGSITSSSNQMVYQVGIRVWKLNSIGGETELTANTPVCVAQQIRGSKGIRKSGSWTCPSASLEATDSMVVRVYGKFQTQVTWSLLDMWITEPLGVQSLDNATWTCYYYLDVYGVGATTYAKFWFDNSTCSSHIEVSGIIKGSFLSSAGSTSSITELNNTGGILKMNEYLLTPYPLIGAVGDGTLATVKFYIKTETSSLLHFNRTELWTVISETSVEIDHDAVDGRYKYPLVHDIAVTNVTAFPSNVIKPSPIALNVTVANQGDFPETFDVTAYYDSNSINTWTDVTLQPQTNTTLTYDWDTTFVGIGTHTVSAKATAVPEETNTANNEYIDGTVTVSNPPEAPTANFTYSPLKPLVLETTTFNASASTPGNGHIVSYTWNFSDGTTQTFIKDVNLTTTTTHAYTQAGTYKVRLTVENNESLTDSVEKTIRVIQNPVSIFTYSPENPIIEETTTFNASASHDNFDAGTIVTYEWNFNFDGVTFNTQTTGKIVTHSYPQIGTYTVALKVTDNDGLVDIATDDVTVLLHDVAVTNIAVSKNTAKIGESISITVTTTNKGNFTETFAITVYYNQTIIETKTVDEMAPNTQRTLATPWNTTGVAVGEATIKAVASIVEGERAAHTTDNTYINGKITLSAEEAPPPPPPSLDIFPYVIAGAVITIILAGTVLYFVKGRKKQ